MHKIGDLVVYGAFGVMTVVDIRDESIGDLVRSYYVLRPTLSNNEYLTFVPTENEQLVSAMRPLLTKDEIMSLLHSAKELPPIDWVNENRARQEYFTRIMESGDRAKMISMIRAINENGQRREAEGKKNFIADENVMRKAQKNITTEFSLVTGIPESEIFEYIKNAG